MIMKSTENMEQRRFHECQNCFVIDVYDSTNFKCRHCGKRELQFVAKVFLEELERRF